MNNSLLPSGLSDLLPPDARKQSHILSSLMTSFERFGYQEVSPPLVENTSTLLKGKGKSFEKETFRFTDPISQKMMGIRADLTIQISRIASTRMTNSPLPLRLSYSGEVMRTKAEAIATQRQLSQAGFELIGTNKDSINGEYEAIMLLLESLDNLGINDVVIDLSYAGLLDSLIGKYNKKDDILKAIKQKNLEDLPICFEKNTLLHQVNSSSGEASSALSKLNEIKNKPIELSDSIAKLRLLVDKIKQAKPKVKLTIDLLEHGSFEYQQGICFSLFITKAEIEAGRGGRYIINHNDATIAPITAVGATFYVNRLLNVANIPNMQERIYLPIDTPISDGQKLRKQQYLTLHGQYEYPSNDATNEANSLNCNLVWQNNKVTKLNQNKLN